MERRHAFTAVIWGKGFAIGRADEGIPGHTPMKPWFPIYKEAQDHADSLNEQLGLTPEDAWEIVTSTMGRPHTADTLNERVN